MAHPPRPAAALRWLLAGVGGLTAFLVILAILHVLNPPSAWPRHVSSFVREQGGWLWDIGLAALGLGLGAIGYGLLRLLPHEKDAARACRLLGWAGACVLVMLVFPTDFTPLPHSAEGWFHDLAAIAAVTLQGAAMLLFVDAGKRQAAWRQVAGTSWFWPGVAVVLGFAWGFGDLTALWPVSMYVQRVLAFVMGGWLIAVGLRARSWAESGTGASLPGRVEGSALESEGRGGNER